MLVRGECAQPNDIRYTITRTVSHPILVSRLVKPSAYMATACSKSPRKMEPRGSKRSARRPCPYPDHAHDEGPWARISPA